MKGIRNANPEAVPLKGGPGPSSPGNVLKSRSLEMISSILRPSQWFYNGSILFNLGIFNLDRPRGPWWKTALHLRCVQTRKKNHVCCLVKRIYLATPFRISLTSVSSPIVTLSEIVPSFHNELSPKTLFLSSPATKFLHLWHICLHFAKRNESMVN